MQIVCVGDCGVDRYVNLGLDRPGGITLNFAANARRLFPVSDVISVVTAIGSDPEAEVVVDALAGLGLPCSVARREGRTPVQYIDREPSGEKRFLRYEAGVLATHELGEPERELVTRSDVLVTNVYGQVEAFFDRLMDIPTSGIRVVDFTDLSDATDGIEFVRRYVDRVDIGFFGLSTDRALLVDGLASLARERGRLLIVTLGPDGSLALERGERRACPAVPVMRVVDTTGAGDAFAAGFLAAFCDRQPTTECLRRGAEVAAEAIQRVGAF